jgi:hypothetical protein
LHVEHAQTVVGESGDVAGVADDQDRIFREAFRQKLLEVGDMLGLGVVDQQDDVVAVGFDGRHGLDGRHEIGGRLVGERDDGHVRELRRLDDAAFDEPAEVDDQRSTAHETLDFGERLAGLQGQDAPVGKCGFVDVGRSVIEIVGDQDCIGVFRIADGMSGFPLPSFNRVEEDGHSAIVIG